MTEEIQVIQKSGIGSDTTNIAIQNNYGISAEQATQIAINMFMDNFPKLQVEAEKVAKERAEELCKEVIKQLERKGKKEYEEFTNPDVQYVFYEAQKGYARFGESELLELLSELVSDRIMAEGKSYVKRVLDKAVELVLALTPSLMDYLSFIFLTKHIKVSSIIDCETLRNHCEYVCKKIVVEPNIVERNSYLNMLGCFELNIGPASKFFSKTYNIDEAEISKILPEQYKYIPNDYALTPAAIVIAIINAQKKTEFTFDMSIWIK